MEGYVDILRYIGPPARLNVVVFYKGLFGFIDALWPSCCFESKNLAQLNLLWPKTSICFLENSCQGRQLLLRNLSISYLSLPGLMRIIKDINYVQQTNIIGTFDRPAASCLNCKTFPKRKAGFGPGPFCFSDFKDSTFFLAHITR